MFHYVLHAGSAAGIAAVTIPVVVFVILLIILVFMVLIIVFVILNKRSEGPQKYNSELADRTASSVSPESKVVTESTEFTSEKEREAFS